jgi:cytochrome c-type biogenesis protein CcmH/NrfG
MPVILQFIRTSVVCSIVVGQLGLYYVALGHEHHAIDAFHKALFIAPDDVAATVHLCRLYLASATKPGTSHSNSSIGSGTERDAKVGTSMEGVDMAAGLLAPLTRGPGWDVPEAWYFLGKAYGMQGRTDQARECLSHALVLSERRGVREIGDAIGWCL